jgi:hypothetical protein
LDLVVPAKYNDGSVIRPSDGEIYKAYSDGRYWIWHTGGWRSGTEPNLPSNYVTTLEKANNLPEGYYSSTAKKPESGKKQGGGTGPGLPSNPAQNKKGPGAGGPSAAQGGTASPV